MLYNKNNRVLLSEALCVIVSLGNLIFKLHISYIKSPRATYYTIVPSTEELYCLNSRSILIISKGLTKRL